MPPNENELTPARIEISEAAKILAKASGRDITEQTILDDIEAGAPRNEDGTVNLIAYAAWIMHKIYNTNA